MLLRAMGRSSRLVLTVVVTGALALSACGEIEDEGGGGSSTDSDQFPEDVYGDLSGSVAWYDSSGGATTEARNKTIFENFTELTGVNLQSDFTGDTAKFFASAEQGQVPWSFVEFPTVGDFIKARDAGYLQKIDTDVVPVDELEDGTYDEYGMNVMRYGMVLTYNTDKWPSDGEHPDDMTDLFDTEKFPGKRCMYQYPQYGATLESALLADGVARDELYPLDVDRALEKLDTIKDDIVWWSDGDEAIRLLTTGECDIGVAWSGRVFNAATKDGAPLAISWNNSMYTDAVYAVPKGAPNAEAGQALLAMQIHDKEGQIAQVSRIPYPTPLKDLSAEDYPDEVQEWLPVGENAEAAIAENEEYYAEEIGDLVEAFNSWLSQN